MAVSVILAGALSPGLCGARTWNVPTDAPTIQAGIDSASAGDDVLVAPGQYMEHDIRMRPGIWLHSQQGPASTTIDANQQGLGVFCRDLQESVTIEGFTIRNGRTTDANGGGIRCLRSQVALRNCTVVNCRTAHWNGGGISAGDCEIEVDACVVTGCYAYGSGGGIYTEGSIVTIVDSEIIENGAGAGGGIAALGPEVTIERCLVSGNGTEWGSGGGIFAVSPALTLRDLVITENYVLVLGGPAGLWVAESSGLVAGCTVVGNRGFTHGDPAVGVMDSTIEIERTIIAFNIICAGLDCNYGLPSDVTTRCCDVYGNTDGNVICGNIGGNFSADPLFCDAANDDYTLDGASPCLPGNHPDGVDCGLIGALGWGCGIVPEGACCLVDGSCTVINEKQCGSQGGAYQGNGTACEPNPCEPTAVERTTWGRVRASFR